MPVPEEIFGDGYVLQGSVDLKPELAYNLTTGLYYDRIFAPGRRFQFESTAFAAHIQNLIKLGGTLIPNYANVGEARVLGIESEIKWDITKSLYTRGDFTLQDIRDVGEFIPGSQQENFFRNLRIPNIPWFFGGWGLEWHAPHPLGIPKNQQSEGRLFYEGRYIADYTYEYEVSRHQQKRIPEQIHHGLSFLLGFWDLKLSISGEVANILDQERVDQFNQPLPGRVYKAKIRVTHF